MGGCNAQANADAELNPDHPCPVARLAGLEVVAYFA